MSEITEKKCSSQFPKAKGNTFKYPVLSNTNTQKPKNIQFTMFKIEKNRKSTFNKLEPEKVNFCFET